MEEIPAPKVSSMSELARLALCSVNTVSLALRDSPRISKTTRARIKELAEVNGYRMNPLVSALITSRRKSVPTQTLALLTKFGVPFEALEIKPQFCTELLAGMRRKAMELGFQLNEFPITDAERGDPARLTGILRARGIRGIILFPSGDVDVPFPVLDWQHFAVVAAGFHVHNWRIHRVALDQGRSMETCLEQLTLRGYRRIGFAITHYLDPRWGFAASGRFLAWQLRQPPEMRIPLVAVHSEFPNDQQFEDWIVQNRPEAVFISQDTYADILYGVNRRHGLDVMPITINVTERPEIPGNNPHIEELGRTSIGVLARELYLNHYGIPAVPEVTLVSGEWREGTGLRPLPASSSPRDAGLHPLRASVAAGR